MPRVGRGASIMGRMRHLEQGSIPLAVAYAQAERIAGCQHRSVRSRQTLCGHRAASPRQASVAPGRSGSCSGGLRDRIGVRTVPCQSGDQLAPHGRRTSGSRQSKGNKMTNGTRNDHALRR